MEYLIGIDLGTTMAKCAIYKENGSVVAEAQREMEIVYPHMCRMRQSGGGLFRGGYSRRRANGRCFKDCLYLFDECGSVHP